jgi:hypothetical protein
LASLLSLFYPGHGRELARFEQVDGGSLSPEYRQLLDHDSHMTITVEAFYNTVVDVRVERTLHGDAHYSREILLISRADGKVASDRVA